MTKLRKGLVSLLLTLCLLLAAGCPVRGDEQYGEKAFGYMRYMAENFPARWANRVGTLGHEVTAIDRCRTWLTMTVESLGYSVTPLYCKGESPLGWGFFEGYNLLFEKTGLSEDWLVICAHYDGTDSAGADDNASGTGLLLELAERFAGVDTPYNLRFLLFDIEEPGCLGSKYYVDTLPVEEREKITCVLNLDSVTAGDHLYVYGGDQTEEGLVRTWAVEEVLSFAKELGLSFTTHPDVNPSYPGPVKPDGSDQMAFNAAGIPYVYFEASNWNGGAFNNMFQTADPRVEGGKIFHQIAYDNMDFLEETFPGRIMNHLEAVSKLASYTIMHLTHPGAYPDSKTEIFTEPEPALVSDTEKTDPVVSDPVTGPEVEAGQDVSEQTEIPPDSTVLPGTEGAETVWSLKAGQTETVEALEKEGLAISRENSKEVLKETRKENPKETTENRNTAEKGEGVRKRKLNRILLFGLVGGGAVAFVAAVLLGIRSKKSAARRRKFVREYE